MEFIIKRNLVTTLFIIISVLFSHSLFANTVSYLISGKISNKVSGEALPFVSVGIFNAGDSSLVSGCLSNEEGIFEINGLSKGEYYLSFNYIGYKSYDTGNLELSEKNLTLDVQLVPENESIEEVTVMGKRSTLSTGLDKQIINVGGNILSEGGTAADALKISPSINIDAEGGISIRGDKNYIVLINGQPTAGDPADVLKQTPANVIKSIELITNPSVKYSAEGTAGIINIVLKRNSDNSFNGQLNASVGTKDKYSADLTLNINKKKFNSSFVLEWSDVSRTAVNNYYRDLVYDSYIHYAFMGQNRLSNDKNRTFRFNSVYMPDSKNNFSYSLNVGQSDMNLDITALNSGITFPASDEQFAYNLFDFRKNATFFTNNLNYKRLIGTKGGSASLNAYYSYINYDIVTEHDMWETGENYLTEGDAPYKQQITNKNYSNDYRVNLDFVLPLNEKNTLETGSGLNAYNRILNVQFGDFEDLNNTWTFDPAYTGKYTFSENVYAGYVNYSTQISVFAVTAGLRLEYMDRILRKHSSNKNYRFGRLDWFPAVSISGAFKHNQGLKLSLSNRLNRPDEYQMNPFPEFEDDYFTAEGNPYLIPELTRSLELAYSKAFKKHAVSAKLYYKKTTDKIEQKLFITEDEKIMVTPHNNNFDVSKGIELGGNFGFANWWMLAASVTGYHYKIESLIDEASSIKRNYAWSAQAVNMFNLGKKTSIQIISYYNSKTLMSQGSVSDFWFIDAALKQQFFNDKLSLSFQMKDIFKSLNYTLLTEDENMNLHGDFINESPIFYLNVSLQISKFNKKTNDVETEIDM